MPTLYTEYYECPDFVLRTFTAFIIPFKEMPCLMKKTPLHMNQNTCVVPCPRSLLVANIEMNASDLNIFLSS